MSASAVLTADGEAGPGGVDAELVLGPALVVAVVAALAVHHRQRRLHVLHLDLELAFGVLLRYIRFNANARSAMSSKNLLRCCVTLPFPFDIGRIHATSYGMDCIELRFHPSLDLLSVEEPDDVGPRVAGEDGLEARLHPLLDAHLADLLDELGRRLLLCTRTDTQRKRDI